MRPIHLRFVGATELPRSLSDFDVEQSFRISAADIAAIRARFRADRRLGVALQLVFLRATGRPLNRTAIVPRALLRCLCAALGVAETTTGNVYFLEDGSLAFIDFGSVGSLRPRRREELVRLGLAVAVNDAAGVVEVLLAWAGDHAVDRSGLEHDITEIIDRLRGVPLGQIDLAEMVRLAFTLLRQHRLALPPDLALVLRTLLAAESFVRRMDPSFHIASELGPLAAELMRERASPDRLKAEGFRLLGSLGRAALSTPVRVKVVVA